MTGETGSDTTEIVPRARQANRSALGALVSQPRERWRPTVGLRPTTGEPTTEG